MHMKHLNTNLILIVLHICDISELLLFYKGTTVQEMKKQSVTDEMLSVFEFDMLGFRGSRAF